MLCQAAIKRDEVRWLSLSLMWPVSFPLSGHSHRLVRTEVMSDSFSYILPPRIDLACLVHTHAHTHARNHVCLLVVTAVIEGICDMVGKGKWMAKRGETWRQRRWANAFNKQTNEWVSWTVMRCFMDAIGKLLFCLLVSTGRSDLLQQPSWKWSCFSVFACWHFSRIRALQTEGHFS